VDERRCDKNVYGYEYKWWDGSKVLTRFQYFFFMGFYSFIEGRRES